MSPIDVLSSESSLFIETSSESDGHEGSDVSVDGISVTGFKFRKGCTNTDKAN